MSKTRSSFLKRQKEVARQARQQEKAARRLEAKQKKAESAAGTPDEDPDIAGIVPGPQAQATEDDADPESDDRE